MNTDATPKDEQHKCPVCRQVMSYPKTGEPWPPGIKVLGYCDKCNARFIVYTDGSYTPTYFRGA